MTWNYNSEETRRTYFPPTKKYALYQIISYDTNSDAQFYEVAFVFYILYISISVPKLRLFIVFFHRIDNSLVVQLMYSSALTTNSSTYPNIGCEVLSYYYAAIKVNVVKTGCYNLTSNSSVSIFGYIYRHNFNQLNPSKNLISRSDVILNSTQFQLITYIQANISYVLVVTTSYPNVTGAFSILASGPSTVTHNHMSE
jgi:hypothetical protein